MNLKEYLAMKYAPSKYPIMSKLPLGYNSPKIQMGNTIGVTRNAVAINPLTGYNVSTGNVMQQFANGSVNNLVSNGDFSNGTTGWVSAYSSLSSSNNIMSVTGIGGNSVARVSQNTSITITTGKKIYVRCRARVTNSVCTSMVAQIKTSGGATFVANAVTLNNPIQNQWYDLSGIAILPSGFDGVIMNIYLYHTYADSSIAVNKVMQLQQVQAIDLSATFGYGVEPTQAWCDANIPFFTGTLSNPPWVKPLVTHGDYGYVGGDTTELTFDFGTKVAGSVVECPVNVYYTGSNTLQIPTGSWGLNTNQTDLDKLKIQENTSITINNSNNGYYAQQMIELDLTPVCNQLYGGSNSALRSAFKNTSLFEIWCSGSGSNSGVLTNGCTVSLWDFGVGNNWGETLGWWSSTNATGSVAKVSITNATYNAISTSNKVYILVRATYASNGTIASSISLDYAKITIGLNRTVDTVTPKSVTLPKYWGMLVKGFSPNWDNTQALDKEVINLYKDSNNWFQCCWYTGNKKFAINCRTNGTLKTTLYSSAFTFNKNQAINFLITNRANGRDFYILKNNGTLEKLTDSTTDVQALQGVLSFYSQSYLGNQYNADSFAESFQLYDLQALGKSSGFTDYEAESILRGDSKYYQTTTSDFSGKVSGSIVENPNIVKYTSANSLLTPSSFVAEHSTNGYGYISSLNGIPYAGANTNINAYIPQQLFSFNLIEIVKRKYGYVQGSTVAEQVAWLKANINTLNFNWYGYGSCPAGNKAFIDMWSVANNRWEYRANNDYSKINNSSSPSLISISKGTSGGYAGVIISNAIDNNGFVHYLSFTDSSNGTIASTIYSDYCSLDVTVKTGNTSAYVPQRELFDINAVTLHANATRSNGVITLNANGVYQESSVFIPVLPNNKYELTGVVTGTNGYVTIRDYYNNVILNTIGGVNSSSGTFSFTTSNKTNKIRVLIGSSSTGTFTFSNISFKLKM